MQHRRQRTSRTCRVSPRCSIATRARPHTASADTRHSFAQRHADAGIPVDVLAELMDHESFETTRTYYASRKYGCGKRWSA
ncbi:tyrosine-type recombinase/integrase [Streptomyces sp. NPDC005423]|uniref:tyrosine-type recombinase/integrase n=1 Tax=Streptomyces sp. NPDC005423 TaxID=3155343 RepID=UPI0033AE096C